MGMTGRKRKLLLAQERFMATWTKTPRGKNLKLEGTESPELLPPPV
jgi:hypothetical protein